MSGKIDRAFEGYLKASGLEDIGPEQRREVRQAFFAGAAVIFSVIIDHAGDHRVLESIQSEIHEFSATLDERCKHTMTTEDGQARANFKDLSSLSEDERIQQIGEHAEAGNVVGVMVDKSDAMKAQRYIDKVTKRFPGTRLIRKFLNPGGALVVLQFGPKTNG